MTGQDDSGAARDPASVPSSREGEIEAALASIRRLAAERSGLAMPPWTGHERPPQPPAPRPERAAAPVTAPPPPTVVPKPMPAERPVMGEPAMPSPPAALPPAERPEGIPRNPTRPGALVLTPDCRVSDRGAVLETLPLRSPVSIPGGAWDEAALRALVTEIVREELRGSLGRSLTGTVRKLVRQEVRRILAERDLG